MPTRSKMGNTYSHCYYNHNHKSKLEASVCDLLHLRQAAGEIAKINTEFHVYLSDAEIGYVVDFKCTKPDGSVFFVEAKGHPDKLWAVKVKLWKVYGPGPLEVWKGTYSKPALSEIIEAKGLPTVT